MERDQNPLEMAKIVIEKLLFGCLIRMLNMLEHMFYMQGICVHSFLAPDGSQNPCQEKPLRNTDYGAQNNYITIPFSIAR